MQHLIHNNQVNKENIEEYIFRSHERKDLIDKQNEQ